MTIAARPAVTVCGCPVDSPCLKPVRRSAGGWVCEAAAERYGEAALSGSASRGGTAPVAAPPDAVARAAPDAACDTHRAASRALTLIAAARCPCAGCEGALASSDWPSWKRCGDCRCHWKQAEIGGRRYACQIRGRCRPEERM